MSSYKEAILLKKQRTFIKKAKQKHNYKYDYSLVNYQGGHAKVKIICKQHGVFEQQPSVHLHENGCPHCGGKAKLSNEEFIAKAVELYGDKYTYEECEYISTHTPVNITCPTHGTFEKRPSVFLRGSECKECNLLNSFLKKAHDAHGDKYDYSKIKYAKSSMKVSIICKEHGEFQQRANVHLSGHGCPKCGQIASNEANRMSLEEFLRRAKEVHGDKYDYSLVKF